MRSLANFFGGLRTLAWSLLMAIVLVLGLVLEMAEQPEAQPSRYTLDDVMDRLSEMERKNEVRFARLEAEVRQNRERIETVNTNLTKQIETIHANLSTRIDDTNSRIDDTNSRIDDTNSRIDDTTTTMRWLFGFLGSLFLGILGLTFAVYRNTAGLSKGISKEIEKPGEDLARVLKTLEALEGEVKATAERGKALEEKLQAAGVI